MRKDEKKKHNKCDVLLGRLTVAHGGSHACCGQQERSDDQHPVSLYTNQFSVHHSQTK